MHKGNLKAKQLVVFAYLQNALILVVDWFLWQKSPYTFGASCPVRRMQLKRLLVGKQKHSLSSTISRVEASLRMVEASVSSGAVEPTDQGHNTNYRPDH